MRRKDRPNIMTVSVIAIALIGAIAVGLGLWKKHEGELTRRRAETLMAQHIATAEDHVKDQMVDPDSAKFYHVNYTPNPGVVCGRYAGLSSTGEKIAPHMFVHFERVTPQWSGKNDDDTYTILVESPASATHRGPFDNPPEANAANVGRNLQDIFHPGVPACKSEKPTAEYSRNVTNTCATIAAAIAKCDARFAHRVVESCKTQLADNCDGMPDG